MNNLTPTELADLERRIAAALPEFESYSCIRITKPHEPEPTWATPQHGKDAYTFILGRAVEACLSTPDLGINLQNAFVEVTEQGSEIIQDMSSRMTYLEALVSVLEQRAAAKGGA